MNSKDCAVVTVITHEEGSSTSLNTRPSENLTSNEVASPSKEQSTNTTFLDRADLSNQIDMTVWPGEESTTFTIPSSVDAPEAERLIRRLLESLRHRCSNMTAVVSSMESMLKDFNR